MNRKFFLPQQPGPSLARLQTLISGGLGPAALKPPTVGRRPAGIPLALTEVADHLTYTATTVTAWYTLEEQVWPFKADTKREALIYAAAEQYAQFAGRHLHLRRTSVPFPTEQWAAALTGNANPLPDNQPPAPEAFMPLDQAQLIDRSWSGLVAAAARRLDEREYTLSRTHLGVVLPRPGRRSIRPGKAAAAAATADRDLSRQIAEITETMSVFGLQGRPCTPDELAWLIYRSVGIGLAPPPYHAGPVGPDDIAEFTENVDWERGPYATTTRLTDRRTGTGVHVAVVTVGRMEPLTIPQIHQPWAHLSEQLGHPVEFSARIGILGPADARGSIEHRLRIIRSQSRDYADHDMDAPLALDRVAARAATIGDEMDTALPADASRAHGWFRMAVHGATEDECLSRVRGLTRMYAQNLHVTLVHSRDQVAQLREFIPGEPAAAGGYVRRMPVRVLAAAMPQATARVGDTRGDLIGYTATSGARPVFYDPHFATEVRERSGLTVVVSEPGGGKSTLMGALGYLNVRRGVRVTLMDPSGPLAHLCELPELRPYSRVVNLTGSQPGTLAPYAMVPDPQRGAFPAGRSGDDEYSRAVADARAERKLLVLDILQMLLPPQVVDSATTVILSVLHEALRRVPAEETSTLDQVVDVLAEMGAQRGENAACHLADMLRDQADYPLARLFFGSPPAGILDTDAALTVITMGGLRLPDMSVPRNFWSNEERMAVPMLHVAHRLAVRRSYSGDPHARKFVGLDEAHVMDGWPSGRAFLIRLGRDSRKWNIAAVVASQNPRDILKLDVQNLVTTAFVGRIAEDEEVAQQALQLLRIPAGAGYEATLAALSQYSTSSTRKLTYREFVMRDVDDRVQTLRVDVSYVPGLLAALNTTPGGSR